MKINRLLGAALLAGALLSSAAYAASTGGIWSTMPTVPTASALTGNELSPADTQLPQGANPQTEVISTTQYRAIQYSQQTPVTAFAITVPAGVTLLQLTPAGTLATGTITFPAAPVDGQNLFIFDTQTQTAVTLTANTGQTINGTAITAFVANTRYGYVYEGANSTWYRQQ